MPKNKDNFVATTHDIYTFIVFAVIDKRDGNKHGHEVVLSKDQLSRIEDIITESPVNVAGVKEFDLVDVLGGGK